jgi:molybdopterin synthase sulfur carrier subunit
VKILYFAWLRERIGRAEEEIDLPETVTDVAGLLDYLRTRGEGYAAALSEPAAVCVAVNHEYVDSSAPVGADDEIALFPPVTGG